MEEGLGRFQARGRFVFATRAIIEDTRVFDFGAFSFEVAAKAH